MSVRVFIIALLFFTGFSAFCQNENLPDIIISTAEYLSADETDPEAATQFIERLMELSENKVKINSGNESEISRLFFLTEFQVKILVDYLRTNGAVATPYEIAYIPGFDTSLAMMIEPFIALDKVEFSATSPSYFKQNLTSNIIYRKDSDTTEPYLQSFKILTKYRAETGHFSTGFTIEKDAGENSVFETHKMPDFLSGYLAFEGTGFVRKVIAGDFSVRTGEGTNISSGLGTLSSLSASDFMAGEK